MTTRDGLVERILKRLDMLSEVFWGINYYIPSDVERVLREELDGIQKDCVDEMYCKYCGGVANLMKNTEYPYYYHYSIEYGLGCRQRILADEDRHNYLTIIKPEVSVRDIVGKERRRLQDELEKPIQTELEAIQDILNKKPGRQFAKGAKLAYTTCLKNISRVFSVAPGDTSGKDAIGYRREMECKGYLPGLRGLDRNKESDG